MGKLNQEKVAFFERYAPLAMAQQQKYGIPASVTLAQMYIESAGGKSNLAQTGNNYFGIKCSSQWLAEGSRTVCIMMISRMRSSATMLPSRRASTITRSS